MVDNSIDEDYLQDVLRVSQEKMTALNALPTLIGFFFSDDFERDEKTQARIFKKGDPLERIRELLAEIGNSDDFSTESLDALYESLAGRNGFKKFDYFPVTRFAVSGAGGGPDLLPMLAVLGKDRVVARFNHFLGQTSQP